MKFYNPFKPHIVEFVDNKFAVRKLSATGWEYYDNQKFTKDDYWWSSPKFTRWFEVTSLLEAQKVLSQIKPKDKKVLRIYT